MAYVRKCPLEMCAGCGRPTRSTTGFCAVEPWCRTMAQRLSYSNKARVEARSAAGKRKWVRRNPAWEAAGILSPLEDLTIEEYDRRMSLVQKILAHKAARRAQVSA